MKICFVDEWRAEIKVAVVEEWRAEMLVAEVEEYRADMKVARVEEWRADRKIALVEEWRAGGTAGSGGGTAGAAGYGGSGGYAGSSTPARSLPNPVQSAVFGGFWFALAIWAGAAFWTYDQQGPKTPLILAVVLWIGTIALTGLMSIGAGVGRYGSMATAGLHGVIAGALVTIGQLFGNYDKGPADWMPVAGWFAVPVGFVAAVLASRLVPDTRAGKRLLIAGLWIVIFLAGISVWVGWTGNYSKYTG